MHGTAFARTQRRTRRSYTRCLRTRTLKNWLPRHWPSRSGAHSDGHSGLRRRRGHYTRRRSFIHRARPGLRHNHARRRRLRAGGRSRCNRTGRSCRSRWRGRYRCRRGRHTSCRRHNHSRRRRRNSRRNHRRRRRNHGGPVSRRRRWNHGGARRRRRDRGSNYWSRRSSHRRRHRGLCGDRRHGRTRRRRGNFLLLSDSSQNISRTGDVGQIDLSLDFFVAAQRARGFGSRRCGFRQSSETDSHLFRLEVFQRTGMGLLLGHADFLQDVENSLAFNFQLPGEIVDSNLAHPAFLVPRVVLGLHRSLTGSSSFVGTSPQLD
jgi:hypothetical protein